MAHYSIEPNDNVTYKLWHEDEDVLVIGKPSKIVTTPGLGHERSSLLNGLFVKYGPRLQQLGRSRDFGLLHRLDKETSGLVIVALTKDAYDALRAQFEARTVAKFYWAVVHGEPKKPTGQVRLPINEYMGKVTGDKGEKKLARVGRTGEAALTLYRVLQRTPSAALLECRAVTGKLHQVRVHLEALGCPILGDGFYAPPAVQDASHRLALHAHRLVFKHPRTQAPLDVRSTWPDDLRLLLKRLGLTKPMPTKAGAGSADLKEMLKGNPKSIEND
jgi:23S rRNA pseudouridine1911/1915/1917 synthase